MTPTCDIHELVRLHTSAYAHEGSQKPTVPLAMIGIVQERLHAIDPI